MLAYRVLRAADRLWQAYAVTFTRKVKRRGVTKKGLAQGKRDGSHKGPNTRSLRALRPAPHPPRLCAVSTPLSMSPSHTPPRGAGKQLRKTWGLPSAVSFSRMPCRSRCPPCAPYGSPSRIRGSQSTSSEQENTERVLEVSQFICDLISCCDYVSK